MRRQIFCCYADCALVSHLHTFISLKYVCTSAPAPPPTHRHLCSFCVCINLYVFSSTHLCSPAPHSSSLPALVVLLPPSSPAPAAPAVSAEPPAVLSYNSAGALPPDSAPTHTCNMCKTREYLAKQHCKNLKLI